MPTTASKAIAKAASQIGGYFPGNSPYGNWYASRHGSVYRNAQFCAMGLSWVFNSLDALDIFPEHAYTPSGAQWFKNKRRWHSGSINNIRRGDILFFDFPGAPNRISHVGIAERDGANGRVQTIEFNTSSVVGGDQRNGRTVARKIRTGSIVGWGRPAYSSKPAWKGALGLPKLRKGDRGNDVKEWQSILKAEGFNLGPDGVDGVFGNDTTKATKAFQRKAKLTADAVVGANTQKAAKKQVNTKGQFNKNTTPSKPASPPSGSSGKPVNNAPKPPPAPKPVEKKDDVRPLQRAVRTTADNKWGKNTDAHLEALRQASAWGGVDFPYGVRFTQKVVGTREDGKWGANSRAAHDATVKKVQRALKEMGFNPGAIDGKWGDRTESAFKAARKANRL